MPRAGNVVENQGIIRPQVLVFLNSVLRMRPPASLSSTSLSPGCLYAICRRIWVDTSFLLHARIPVAVASVQTLLIVGNNDWVDAGHGCLSRRDMFRPVFSISRNERSRHEVGNVCIVDAKFGWGSGPDGYLNVM